MESSAARVLFYKTLFTGNTLEDLNRCQWTITTPRDTHRCPFVRKDDWTTCLRHSHHGHPDTGECETLLGRVLSRLLDDYAARHGARDLTTG